MGINPLNPSPAPARKLGFDPGFLLNESSSPRKRSCVAFWLAEFSITSRGHTHPHIWTVSVRPYLQCFYHRRRGWVSKLAVQYTEPIFSNQRRHTYIVNGRDIFQCPIEAQIIGDKRECYSAVWNPCRHIHCPGLSNDGI